VQPKTFLTLCGTGLGAILVAYTVAIASNPVVLTSDYPVGLDMWCGNTVVHVRPGQKVHIGVDVLNPDPCTVDLASNGSYFGCFYVVRESPSVWWYHNLSQGMSRITFTACAALYGR
jgi:hypothetical protein